MSLKQNDKKIKSIFIFVLTVEFLTIFYLFLEIYTTFNKTENLVYEKVPYDTSFVLDKAGEREDEAVDFYITASKNGSKYYYKHCSGINRIKSENMVFFDSESAAEDKGYTLAVNCDKK